MASTNDTISHLTSLLQDQVSTYKDGDEQQRQKLLATTSALLRAVETPSERIARMCYADNFLFIATRVLVELDVFRIIAKANGPTKVEDLAKETGAEEALLARLLKHVCTQGFVEEVGADEYGGSGITEKLASPEGTGIILDMFNSLRIGARFPEYLQERAYRNPTNKDDSLWKYGMDTPDHYFEYITRPGRERAAEAFHNHMRFKTLGLKWHQMPNIMSSVFGESATTSSSSSEEVLIVDVGGSSGHDLVSFRSNHPDIKGRLILQDLPETISAAKTAGELSALNIEAMAHDFFTPQPIPNARVYYLKMVLHDWPNAQCAQILSNLKPALKAGHSRILLNEIIIPEVGAGWFETSVDMIMMCAHSAQERRERDWRGLVEGVGGLKVGNVWGVDGAVEKVIEVLLE